MQLFLKVCVCTFAHVLRIYCVYIHVQECSILTELTPTQQRETLPSVIRKATVKLDRPLAVVVMAEMACQDFQDFQAVMERGDHQDLLEHRDQLDPLARMGREG